MLFFITDKIERWKEHHAQLEQERLDALEHQRIVSFKQVQSTLAYEEFSHYLAGKKETDENGLFYQQLEKGLCLRIRPFVRANGEEEIEIRLVSTEYQLTLLIVCTRNRVYRLEEWFEGCQLP